MAISSRELLLILRARDEASRVLRGAAGAIGTVSAAAQQAAQRQMQQGAAMTTVGVAAAAAGIAAIKWMDDATKAAMEYNNQSAKTLTQVDQVGVKMSTIKDIGRDVGNQVPTDFKKIQTSLYDIFSSMDVSVPQAKVLLTEFAKASVAGQVDLQDASRATMGIMNAYGMKVGEVNRVNDVMFQLVRKGVGTYGEFSSTIGRAIPSAVRAGQSVETLAGMMAFLTRNGLSAAMASSSAGRALDAISHPKTIQNFDNLGKKIEGALGKDRALQLFGKNYKNMSVDIRDAEGNIRPMPAIMTDLGKTIGNLPAADRAAILQELFKGSGGTIQARRFFDIAIKQYGQFNDLTNDMINSKGAMEAAYKIMFDDPQVKLQMLSNKWNILKTIVGDILLPIKMAIVDFFTVIIDGFNRLPAGVQQGIVIFLAILAVLITLAGIVTAIAGLWLMFQAALALAGTTFMAMAGPILIVIGVIVALAAIIFLVWKYHDQLFAIAQRVWTAIITFLDPVIQTVKNVAGAIGDLVIPMMQKLWENLQQSLIPAWEKLKGVWDTIVQAGKDIWAALQPLEPVLKLIGMIVGVVLVAAFLAVIGAIMIVVNVIGNVLGPIIEAIVGVIKGAVDIIIGIVKVFVGILTGDWSMMWEGMKQIVSGAWEIIKSIFVGVIGVIVGLVKGLWQGVVAVFEWAWDLIVGHSIVPDMVKAIILWMAKLPVEVIKAVTSLLTSFAKWATDVMKKGLDAIVAGGTVVLNYFKNLPSNILQGISTLASLLYNAGKNALTSLVNGMKSAGSAALDYVRDLAGQVRDLWPFSPAKAGPLRSHPLDKAGANMMNMLGEGINSRKAFVLDSMKSIAYDVSATPLSAPVVPGYAGGPGAGESPSGGDQNFYITTQEIDPTKHAADLGYEIARRRG